MRSWTLTALLLALSLLASSCFEDDAPRGADDAALADVAVDAGAIPESSGATVGPAGGVVAVDGVILRVPEGALSEDVDIQIEQHGSVAWGYRLQSPIYQFSPAGLTFLKPVELEMDFGGAGEWTQIFWSRPTEPGYDALQTEVRANVAVGQITHFSTGFVGFELAAEPELLAAPCANEPLKAAAVGTLGAGRATTAADFRTREPAVVGGETWTAPGAVSSSSVDGMELVMEPTECGDVDVLVPLGGQGGGERADSDDDDPARSTECPSLERPPTSTATAARATTAHCPSPSSNPRSNPPRAPPR